VLLPPIGGRKEPFVDLGFRTGTGCLGWLRDKAINPKASETQ